MGKPDTAINLWLSDKKRFADLFNSSLFCGEQIISPDELDIIDRKSETLFTDKQAKLQNLTRYRDVIMRWENKANLILLACENQESVHYAMPIRTMLYDALNYLEQIRSVQQNNNDVSKTTAEFLSGFSKNDQLFPIITLVVYYGEEPWDGPCSLHDMMNPSPLSNHLYLLKKYIPNYHINLIDVRRLEDFSSFKTDLQIIFQMLKYDYTQHALYSFIQRNKSFFKAIDIETYNVIRVLLKSQAKFKDIKKIRNQEVRIDMCKALDELYNSGVEAGIKEKLEELVQKKLSKGLNAKEIADILEEDITVIESIISNSKQI